MFGCGGLGLAAVPPLWNQCAGRLAGGCDIELDFGKLERSDSAGLAFLVACFREARRNGGEIRFFNLPVQMMQIVRVSSLDQVLPLQQD